MNNSPSPLNSQRSTCTTAQLPVTPVPPLKTKVHGDEHGRLGLRLLFEDAAPILLILYCSVPRRPKVLHKRVTLAIPKCTTPFGCHILSCGMSLQGVHTVFPQFLFFAGLVACKVVNTVSSAVFGRKLT